MMKNRYITDEEVSKLLGFKHYRSYKYSNTKQRVDNLLVELLKRVEELRIRETKALKDSLIDHIKGL